MNPTEQSLERLHSPTTSSIQFPHLQQMPNCLDSQVLQASKPSALGCQVCECHSHTLDRGPASAFFASCVLWVIASLPFSRYPQIFSSSPMRPGHTSVPHRFRPPASKSYFLAGARFPWPLLGRHCLGMAGWVYF